MPKCRDCGATINFITLPSGKPLPTDPGVKRIVTVQGEFVEGFEPHAGNWKFIKTVSLREGEVGKMLVLFETELRGRGDIPVYSDTESNTYIIKNDIAFPIDREKLPCLKYTGDGTPQLEYSISESLLKAEGIHFQKGRLVKPIPAYIKNILNEVKVKL